MPARLTRRQLVAGAGAAALARNASAEIAPTRTFIGKSAAELSTLVRAASADGYGLAGLSIYGPERAPLYAALMRPRPTPPSQRHWLALTAAEVDKIIGEQAKEGYGPALISAMGSATKPLFALVCEPQAPLALIRLNLKPGKSTDKGTIEGMNAAARREGRILRCAAPYGSAADPRFAAIWTANKDKAAWNADGVADTAAVYRAREMAHASAWCRPVLVAPAPDGRILSVFADDQVDQWTAATDLSGAALARQIAAGERQGLHPISLQADGANAASARFATILVRDDAVLPCRWTATGPVANAEIDGVMKAVMTRSRIRQASLAIVKGARLVYARGYTYAEEDWPVTQPTTCFRLASVSKTVTTLALYQLIERGKLALSDRMQDILQLRTPSGGPPKDKRFGEITIEQLLAHRSGLGGHALAASLDVRRAFSEAHPGKPWHLPVSAAMMDSYIASLELAAPPGKSYVYNNCAYYLLARIVARLHGEEPPMAALRTHLLEPLGIARMRRARSLVAAQLPDEARYGVTSIADHQRDIPLVHSVMSDDQPLVPVGYGSGQLEISEGAGGLAAAMPDLGRLIAILIDRKDNPALRRDTLREMLTNAATRRGHGLDDAKDLGEDRFYGQKGGALSTSRNVLQLHGEFGFALCWAGVPDADVRWYPDFPALMNVAHRTKWGDGDLFGEFGMAAL